MWYLAPIAGGIAAGYYLLLRRLNIIEVRPQIEAERDYEGLKIGMKRWKSWVEVFARGNLKGKEVRMPSGPMMPDSTRFSPESVVRSLNYELLKKRNPSDILPYDDPNLLKIIDELYDEMRVLRPIPKVV